MPFASQTLLVRVKSTGVDAFTNSLDEATQAVGGLRNAAGLAAGAIGAIGFAAAAKQAADFEAQMIEVQKVTSEATADELSRSLQELAKTTPTALNELTKIAEVAGRLGIEGSDNITQFTDTVSMMAVATDITAEDAANSLARLSNALNTPIERSEMMASVINELSNNVAASADEITRSMLKAAPAAGQLGFEFEEVASLASTLVASGMQVERAGTRLNRMFTKMAQNTEPIAKHLNMTEEEFKALVDESPREALMRVLEALNEIDNSAQRISIADEIFGAAGAKSANVLSQNLEDLRGNLQMAQEETKNVNSIQEEFNDALESAHAQFDILVNRIKVFGTTTGNNFLPIVKGAIAALSGFVGALNLANKATNGWLGTIIIGGALIAGLVTAIGLLSSFVGGTLVPAFLAGAGALNVFNLSLGVAAGTAAALIGTLAIVGAVLVGLATNVGHFRDRVIAGFTAAKIAAETFWMGLKNTGKAVINALTQMFEGFVNNFIGGINSIIQQYNRVASVLDRQEIDPVDPANFATDFEMTDTREFAAEQRRGLRERLRGAGVSESALEGGARGAGQAAALLRGDQSLGGLLGGAGGAAREGAATGGRPAGGQAGLTEKQRARLNELIGKTNENLGKAAGNLDSTEKKLANIRQKMQESAAAQKETATEVSNTNEQMGRVSTDGPTSGLLGGRGGAGRRPAGGVSDVGAASEELDVDITFDTSDDAFGKWLRDKIDVRVAKKDRQNNRDIRRRGRKA
jgi:TP901 family phage tail tape measure protein